MITLFRFKIVSFFTRNVEVNRFYILLLFPIYLFTKMIIKINKNFKIYFILKVLRQAISRVLSCFNTHNTRKLWDIVNVKLWNINKTLETELKLILLSLSKYYNLPGEYYVPPTTSRKFRITAF